MNFKQTFLESIPNDWEVVKLGNICKVETGKRTKGGAVKFGIPSIGGEQIDTQGGITWDKMKYIPETFYDSLRQGRLKLKDVLMVKDGATTGKIAFLRDLPVKKAAVNEHVFIFRSVKEDQLMNEILFYALFSEIGQSQVRSSFHGACQGGINRQNVNDFLIPLPSLPEQRRIATVLSTIQKAIEQQDKIIETTRKLKKTLMHTLFTEGLNGEEQKETEIGLIPRSWEVVRLGDIAQLKNGINFDRTQKGERGILTIDVLNMYTEGIYIDLEKLYRVSVSLEDKPDYLLRNGDILFVRSSLKREGVGWASLFKEGNEPVTFCGFIIRARLNEVAISPEFFTYFLRSDLVRTKFIKGSEQVAITNINQGLLRNLTIPLPPLPEQHQIAHILSIVDNKIEVEERRKATLKELFKTMLHKLVTGAIRVKDVNV